MDDVVNELRELDGPKHIFFPSRDRGELPHQILETGNFAFEALDGGSQMIGRIIGHPAKTLLQELNRERHAVERIGELMTNLSRRCSDGR